MSELHKTQNIPKVNRLHLGEEEKNIFKKKSYIKPKQNQYNEAALTTSDLFQSGTYRH